MTEPAWLLLSLAAWVRQILWHVTCRYRKWSPGRAGVHSDVLLCWNSPCVSSEFPGQNPWGEEMLQRVPEVLLDQVVSWIQVLHFLPISSTYKFWAFGNPANGCRFLIVLKVTKSFPQKRAIKSNITLKMWTNPKQVLFLVTIDGKGLLMDDGYAYKPIFGNVCAETEDL